MSNSSSEVRLWAYVSAEADARIRLLAFTRSTRGTVGRVCGEAVQEFLDQHQAEHDQVIADYLERSEQTAYSWTNDNEADTQGVWAYVDGEAFKRLTLLTLAYGLSKAKTHLLVRQAIYEYLAAHWDEHEVEIASIQKLIDEQPSTPTHWTRPSTGAA